MKILVICSKNFYSEIEKIKKYLEKKNIEVFLPNCYNDPTAEQKAWALGKREHQKFLEMYDAFRLGKNIYLYNDIPEGMLYDEIEGFNPIIINGNLEKIK